MNVDEYMDIIESKYNEIESNQDNVELDNNDVGNDTDYDED